MVDGSSWAWRSMISESRIEASVKHSSAPPKMTKAKRATQAREATTAKWKLKTFERVLARINPSLGDAVYLSRPQDLLGSYHHNESSVAGRVMWESLPEAADPCRFMNRARGLRKRQQIDNLVALLRQLVQPGDHIVDFCGGGGHMSIPLALAFPTCTITLLDAKLESLLLARRRLNACSLANHRVRICLIRFCFFSISILCLDYGHIFWFLCAMIDIPTAAYTFYH